MRSDKSLKRVLSWGKDNDLFGFLIVQNDDCFSYGPEAAVHYGTNPNSFASRAGTEARSFTLPTARTDIDEDVRSQFFASKRTDRSPKKSGMFVRRVNIKEFHRQPRRLSCATLHMSVSQPDRQQGREDIEMTVFKCREDVTGAIIAARVAKGVSWCDVATAVEQSKEWTVAACLGQMAFTSEQAGKIVALFDLDETALPWLQIPPSKGSLSGAPPADPLLYRLHEIVSVFGPAIKELIHEEFGDGIMSAIDFKFEIAREANPAGDRVSLNMSGKFLPYKAF
ncbi:cyanase [Acetobacter nitrogenifigens]|uniref:Cyanate hydratase n=2 Tax=Acetobacter nitrogenifigens TaxID=285268 RepID=A0A511XD36_9PROT|nr:cyanase [Acetobacter nitrogenifigens]GEN60876.1 hypothetical protein ANI02nite_27600 [Acetobacter nitrogenifigens DSM 23921 = NBRC 105050]